MQDVVSIVIPVYNAESFLTICLSSICSQTYQALEIILVDDGSVDRSLAICNEYASRDGRVVVIHQENKGVSAARNVGIQIATGKYIAFIDADDYIKKDYFERLVRDITEHNADMVCCNMIELQDGKEISLSIPRVIDNRLVTDDVSFYRDIALECEGYWATVWGKLIKTDLAKRHTFSTSIRYGEDQIYIYDLLLEKPKVYLDIYKGYYYIRHDLSATCKKTANNILRYFNEVEMFRYKALNLPIQESEIVAKFFEAYANALHLAAVEVIVQGTDDDINRYSPVLASRACEIPMEKLSLRLRAKTVLLKSFFDIYRLIYRKKYGGV